LLTPHGEFDETCTKRAAPCCRAEEVSRTDDVDLVELAREPRGMDEARAVEHDPLLVSDEEPRERRGIGEVAAHRARAEPGEELHLRGSSRECDDFSHGRWLRVWCIRNSFEERLHEALAEPSGAAGDDRLHHAAASWKWSAFRRASAMMLPCGFTPGESGRMLASATRRFSKP
jgi:hypothetical protein